MLKKESELCSTILLVSFYHYESFESLNDGLGEN